MNPIRPFWRLREAVVQNADLAVLWWATVVAQPLIPSDHLLARDDLLPWFTMTLSGAALLRARPLGLGPHPQLARRSDPTLARMRQFCLATVPWLLFLLFEGARAEDPRFTLAALLAGAVAAWVLKAAAEDAETAWSPPGLPDGLMWLLLGAFAGGGAFGLGNVVRQAGANAEPGIWAIGGMLGLGFFTASLAGANPRSLRQRVAAGQEGDPPLGSLGWSPAAVMRLIRNMTLFRPAMALLGPSGGYIALRMIAGPAGAGTIDHRAAFVASMHVVAWAVVLWPSRVPVAVHCLLHEIVPSSGSDEDAHGAARPFDLPPAGALRLNPLKFRRTRSIHPWLVPVQSARIGELDDPVRAIWDAVPPPQGLHVLGEASFPLDGHTASSQWDRLLIRLHAAGDTATLSDSNAQVRRIVVLQPFPDGTGDGGNRAPTYVWDDQVPAGAIQEVDASTETLHLRHGSILVLVSGGTARAYELEVGAPVYAWEGLAWTRPPQYQDYVP